MARGIVCALLGALLFAVMGGLIRSLPVGTPPGLVLFVRGGATVLAFLFAALRCVVLERPNGRLVGLTLVRGFALGAANYCSVWVVIHLGVAPARAMSDLSILGVALLQVLRGRLLCDVRLIGAFVCGCAGVLGLQLVASRGSEVSLIPVGLLGAVFALVSNVSLGEAARVVCPSFIVFVYGVALVVIGPAVPGGSWGGVDMWVAALLVLVAAVSVAGQWCVVTSFRLLETASAAFWGFATLPFSLLVDMVIARHLPSSAAAVSYIALGLAAWLGGGLARKRSDSGERAAKK